MEVRVVMRCTLVIVLVFGGFGAGCGDDDGQANNNNLNNAHACGDGVIQGLEECDDGASNSDALPDACRTDCTDPTCGDGVLDSDEQCDEGGSNDDAEPDACRTSCLSPHCGDGVEDPGEGEVCDDANTVGGDGCAADCRSLEVCGNGLVDTAAGEACEDGNIEPWDGCRDCQIVEFQVNVETQYPQQFPDVAMAPTGGFLVVWNSMAQDGDDMGVFSRYYSSQMVAGPEIQLNTLTNGAQSKPRVEAAGDGSFLVTWFGPGDGDGQGVVARRLDSAGQPLLPEQWGNATTVGDQMTTTVGVADDGAFRLFWIDYVGPSPPTADLYLRCFGANSQAVTGDMIVNVSPGDGFFPDIAVGSAGNAVTVWYSHDTDYPVRAQRWTAGCAQDGPAIQVNTDTSTTGGSPKVALAADGSFAVVWVPTVGEMVVRLFDNTGAPLGPESQVNSHTVDYQGLPDIAMAPGGAFVVVWQSTDQDGDMFGVYAQRFTAAGVADGPEIPVNVFTQGSQLDPRVSMAADGSFVVVWDSQFQDSDYEGVFAQRFDSLGNPLGRTE